MNDRTHRYLADLHEGLTGRQPGRFTEADTERLVAAFAQSLSPRMSEEIREEQLTTLRRKISSGELRPGADPSVQLILDPLVDEIQGIVEMIADKSGKEPPRRPAVTTLPLGQPNAVTLKVPDSANTIVAFTSLLPALLSSVIKIYIEVHQAANQAQLQAGIQEFDANQYALMVQSVIEKDPILQHHHDLSVASFTTGSDLGFRRRDLPEELEGYRASMIWGAELFVVAHEYGHITFNHLPPSCAIQARQHDGQDLEAVQRSHKEELLADMYGRTLSLSAIKLRAGADQDHYEVMAAGASIFFFVAHAVDSFYSTLPGTEVRFDSHPRPGLRSAMVERQYTEISGLETNWFVREFRVIAAVLAERMVRALEGD